MLIRVDSAADGLTNMARDRALLEMLPHSNYVGRVYSWGSPWVSLGHYEVPSQVLLGACGVPSVIRPTGGKAVLHGHDLTIGLAARLDAIGAGPKELKHAYRAIIEPIVAALNDSGMPAILGEKTSFVRGAGKVADCFAHISPNDVVDPQTGQKVCGCALKIDSTSILLQASIPIGIPKIEPSLVFQDPAPKSRPVNISQELLAELLNFYFDQRFR